jgi:predicted site-specific integrase-resolvase
MDETGQNMSNSLSKTILLKPQDVATRLGVSIATLATWRCTKRYALTYMKIGRLVRYRLADVEAFEASRSHEVAGI